MVQLALQARARGFLVRLKSAFYMISAMSLFYCSVLSNKLDAPMLNGIIAALRQEIVPQGNC